eukprot:TRINITY_DN6955_c0_g1_i3.p1 TRINITY_DN6955_c0_g1~~TRINITY_DN6955_c0_g1_i3.p1  ORF type:complete len:282 (-),score=46.07 TRINITY_DN6955_c0_g1_i3:127-972(-)
MEGMLVVLFLLLATFYVGFINYVSTVKNQSPEGHNGLYFSFSDPPGPNTPWVEQVSWEPRIFVFHNLLTQEECEHIIGLGKADISRSLVVGATGQSVQNEVRSSSGVFLGASYMTASPLLRNIERRAAEFTHLGVNQGEAFYLLRYGPGEQYKPHYDYFSGKEGESHIGNSGNRIATLLFYLHTPDEGGETIFPDTRSGSIEVKARAGDAVLFWDVTPDNQPDFRALHGGKPVINGVKWAMTKWIRANPTIYSWRSSVSAEELWRLDKEELEWVEQGKQLE